MAAETSPPDAPRTHLEEDARQLRAVADAVPALIAYVDANERYRYNNQAYASWFGRTPHELRGIHISELLGPAAYTAVHDEIRKVLSGVPTSYEKLVPYEGGPRWTSTRFIPDIAPNGKVMGFVALVVDITDRKRAEEDVKKIQAQLLLADRLASVGTLAMGIAHEINNPLAIVIANQDYVISALSKALADPARQQASNAVELLATIEEPLRDARQAAGRVAGIVRELEVFSCPDSRHHGPVDVHRVLTASIAALGDTIRNHGDVVTDYGEVPPVDANEALLGQVFLHLLVNAAQAIREGDTGTNEIRVTTRTDATGQIRVQVADTGRGIAPEHVGRIFDPFFTTRPVGKGVGLGLWVSSQILGQIGGHVAVESELGKGTIITVTLPAASVQP